MRGDRAGDAPLRPRPARGVIVAAYSKRSFTPGPNFGFASVTHPPSVAQISAACSVRNTSNQSR